jgi:hypothetical protein
MVRTSGSLGGAAVVAPEGAEVVGGVVVDDGADADGLPEGLLVRLAGPLEVEVAGAAALPEQEAVRATARPAAARGARARMGPESRSP